MRHREGRCMRHKRHRFDPWVGKIPLSGKWQPAPVFSPGKFHGLQSLVGYSPRGRKELDTTERTHTPLKHPEPQMKRKEPQTGEGQVEGHRGSKWKSVEGCSCNSQAGTQNSCPTVIVSSGFTTLRAVLLMCH